MKIYSQSFLYLILRLIFCQLNPNFINVCTAYTSKIWVQLTKNFLTKASTKRFREYVKVKDMHMELASNVDEALDMAFKINSNNPLHLEIFFSIINIKKF